MSRKLGFEFMRLLVADMVQADPSERPNMDEAVQRWQPQQLEALHQGKRPFRPYFHHRKNSGLAGCGSAVAGSSWFTTLLLVVLVLSRPSASCPSSMSTLLSWAIRTDLSTVQVEINPTSARCIIR
jgi:hypothetical protein